MVVEAVRVSVGGLPAVTGVLLSGIVDIVPGLVRVIFPAGPAHEPPGIQGLLPRAVHGRAEAPVEARQAALLPIFPRPRPTARGRAPGDPGRLPILLEEPPVRFNPGELVVD